jgi:hypothetical protein
MGTKEPQELSSSHGRAMKMTCGVDIPSASFSHLYKRQQRRLEAVVYEDAEELMTVDQLAFA